MSHRLRDKSKLIQRDPDVEGDGGIGHCLKFSDEKNRSDIH